MGGRGEGEEAGRRRGRELIGWRWCRRAQGELRGRRAGATTGYGGEVEVRRGRGRRRRAEREAPSEASAISDRSFRPGTGTRTRAAPPPPRRRRDKKAPGRFAAALFSQDDSAGLGVRWVMQSERGVVVRGAVHLAVAEGLEGSGKGETGRCEPAGDQARAPVLSLRGGEGEEGGLSVGEDSARQHGARGRGGTHSVRSAPSSSSASRRSASRAA